MTDAPTMKRRWTTISDDKASAPPRLVRQIPDCVSPESALRKEAGFSEKLRIACRRVFSDAGLKEDQIEPFLASIDTAAISAEIQEKIKCSLFEGRSPSDLKVDQYIKSECDHRMRSFLQPSPFYRDGGCHGASNEEVLAYLRRSPHANADQRGIFDLACELWRIDRYPSHRRDFESLEEAMGSAGLLQDIIAELRQEDHPHASAPPGKKRRLFLLDSIKQKNRMMMACALEAIRGWSYNSSVERTVMFWGIYKLLKLLVFPTVQNLDACPVWFRPTHSQLSQPHPSWVDFVPVPGIRQRLIPVWESYRETDFFSTLLTNFHVQTSSRDDHLLLYSSTGTELIPSPALSMIIGSEDNLAMGQDFFIVFPQLSQPLEAGGNRLKQFIPQLTCPPELPPLIYTDGGSLASLGSTTTPSPPLPTYSIPDLPDLIYTDGVLDDFDDALGFDCSASGEALILASSSDSNL